jgi:hypothetical protein
MLPVSRDEVSPKKAPSRHSPGPPDDRPDNPPEVVVETPDDITMEVEEPPPAEIDKENNPRNLGSESSLEDRYYQADSV